jgi:hypothetical protein
MLTFLISLKCVKICRILYSILKLLEKSLVYQLFHEVGTDNNPDRMDPDRHALNAHPASDLDPVL